MHRLDANLIRAIWLILLIVWLVLAFRTKRTIRRQRGSFPTIVIVLLAVAVIERVSAHDLYTRLWRPSLFPAGLCVFLTLFGAAFAIWARFTIGANWSGVVTLKEDHELIQSGPYAYVRHPIYSGLILMGIATAAFFAQPYEFIIFSVVLILFIFKMRMEEQLMIQQFQSEYLEYRKRVKAIIPFLL